MPNSNKEVKELGIEKFAVVSPPDDDSFFFDFNFRNTVGTTAIGSGDQIRVDLTNTPYKRSNTMGEARGAYQYLQLIGGKGEYGSSTRIKLPNAVITSGCGWRDVSNSPHTPPQPNFHQAIDIAGVGIKLPQTCPFKEGYVKFSGGIGIILIEELKGTTRTGRACRFIHTNQRLVEQGDKVKFGDVVGHEGTANNYDIHSHFEMMFLNRKADETTVDGKTTVKDTAQAGAAFFCPTIEEIKCGHGMSPTPLPYPVKETLPGNIINYKCISSSPTPYDPPTSGAILMTGLTSDKNHQY